MIADTTKVLYNSEEKKVIMEIQAGWEYHSNAEVFDGNLEEFKIAVQDEWDAETAIERADPEPIEDIS